MIIHERTLGKLQFLTRRLKLKIVILLARRSNEGRKRKKNKGRRGALTDAIIGNLFIKSLANNKKERTKEASSWSV